ncbi:hypothetical protein [Pseudomonas sp. SWRI154]|uniref:hypothetical protein n=1 Tax=Pseudomonas sp. SWRI154 TaxID=2745501 RepID=UPI001648C626|nr:hypothetical protein [Pseudomonas sp. SWRI154]MBC3366369.1 hypothetical protein [Pseudomonas sp. SWRI154]
MKNKPMTATPTRAGEFDPEFNGGQILFLPGTDAVDVAIDSEDRIYIVGGTALWVNGEYIISALNPDGTNRADFNGGEPVRNSFMPGAWCLGTQVAVLPDGKILILGPVELSNAKFGFALARYLPNGALDLSYGVNGHAVPVFDFGDAVIARNDPVVGGNEAKYLYTGTYCLFLYGGRTYISGFALRARKGVTLLMCLDEDGNLVQTFGNGGGAVIEHPEHHLNARSMLVVNDAIYLAGYVQARQGNYSAWARVRLDGRLDTRFGKGGFIFEIGAGHGGGVNFKAIALKGDQKILGVGTALDIRMTYQGMLESIDQDGGNDVGFNDGAPVVTSIGPESDWFDCAVQPDGRIVTCGYTGADRENMLVARYLPDGRLDTSFGDNEGWIQFRMKDEVYQPALALHSNGDIVVTGRYFDDRSSIPFAFRLKG